MLLIGSLLSAHRDAHACGATPIEARPLLPLDGATSVPLTAVLTTSANLTQAGFELREVAAAANGLQTEPLEPSADAGVTAVDDAGAPSQVELDVDCSPRAAEGGALCLARPRESLKPDPRYAWPTNAAASDGYIPPLPWMSGASSPRGMRSTTIAYSLRASEPAVLRYAAYTPSCVMHARCGV